MSFFKNANNVVVNGGNFTASHQSDTVQNNRTVTQNNYTMPEKIHQGNITSILHHFSALGGLLDSEERFDAPKCDPDTRRAILRTLEDRIEAGNLSSSSSLLWLHGPAGAGKSALMQQIALLLKDKGNYAGGFFFSRTYVGRNNGSALIVTLAYQLCINFPPIRARIAKNVKRNPGIFSLSNRIKMEFLIVDPINALRKSWVFNISNLLFPSPRTQPRLIVIDGLDECDNPEIQSDILLVVAHAVERLRMPFRFIIASRPEAHILSSFRNEIFSTINYTQKNLGEDDEAEGDVRTFLSNEFKNIRSQHPLAQYLPHGWPTQVEMDALVFKSSGGFIYPTTVIKYIKSPHLRPHECLNVILGLSANQSPSRPYAQLDDLYDYVFRSTHEEHKRSIKLLFRVLVIPRIEDDELGVFTTPTLLEELLYFPDGHVEQVLGNLLCLVSLHGRDNPVKLLHASLSDFLLDRERSGQFFSDVGLAHKSLAHGYVTQILKSTPTQEVEDLDRWRTTYTFTQYFKNLNSTYYPLAAKHSDQAFQNGIPYREAYASLDTIHERVMSFAHLFISYGEPPKVELEWHGGSAHCDTITYAVTVFPYLFDEPRKVEGDKFICTANPPLSEYLLDQSRSGLRLETRGTIYK